jgi:spermidine synthase
MLARMSRTRTARLLVPLVVALLIACATSERSAFLKPPAPGPATTTPRVLEAVDGIHGRIEVLERDGSLALAVDGVLQTVFPAAPLGIAKGMLLRGGDHVELIPYYRPAARTALLIGLGGGLEARALALYGLEVTAVEIEPEVARIAAERFGVACETIVADGREVLEGDPRRFDAIVIDAFAGADPPAHLYTREAFEAASRRLAQEGILAVHLIGRPGHPAIAAVARTLEAVFPRVTATRSGPEGGLEHLYLFASPAPLELGPWVRAEVERLGLTSRAFTSIDTHEAPILSDAHNDLPALGRDLAEEHRRRSVAIRRSPPW